MSEANTTFATADELAVTEAGRAALAALRAAAADAGADDALERHSVRMVHIARRIAREPVDEELLLVACLLHDIGVLSWVAGDRPYVTEGRDLAAGLLEPYDWAPERVARCLDAIERHHHLRSQWSCGHEVELVRRADLVDVSKGLVAFGVRRGWLRQLVADIPRGRFDAQVVRFAAGQLRRDPLALLKVARAGGSIRPR